MIETLRIYHSNLRVKRAEAEDAIVEIEGPRLALLDEWVEALF